MVGRLAERRRRCRPPPPRSALAFSILLLLLLAAAGYGLWQSPVRISSVDVYGPDASLGAYAREAMRGSYLGIIPRDSIFFFPEERIRADILSANSDIAAVSISRNGFAGISIQADYRVPIARWCGSTISSQAVGVEAEEHCYVFDASGIIFSAVSSTTQTVNAFKLYAPLDVTRGGSLAVSEVEPLHAVILDADKVPTVFDFARQLVALGSPVASVALRDGEVTLHLVSGTPSTKSDLVLGTRIIYLLGREQDALTALTSARENFNLADGSVEYIDLRFDGKVYVKRRAARGDF